jgi:hypothetical protein
VPDVRESALAGPVTTLPVLGPSSVRRVMAVTTAPDPAWDAGLVCTGMAQDVAADAVGQPQRLATADCTARLAADATVRDLVSPVPAARELAGTRATSGFRRRLASLGDSPSSLAMALLDELPTLFVVSGYARAMESAHRRGPRVPPLLNVCAGWAEGGTADRGMRASGWSLRPLPAAPPLQVPLSDGDHDRALAPGMTRQRLLDVTATGSRYEVFEYFRDSYVDPAGAEFSLHEYVVRATVAAEGLVLRSLEVDARALPYPECPLAAGPARSLVGVPLARIQDQIRTSLAGTRGCTHLNDTLRFLRFVPALIARLTAD